MAKRLRVVLAATTESVANALTKDINAECRTLGIRVQIGASETSSTFQDKEELFASLDEMDPSDLLDLVVVMHLGIDYAECFESRLRSRNSSWHHDRSINHGVAVELVLRYPQVFPLFVITKDASFHEWLGRWLSDASVQDDAMLTGWELMHFVDVFQDKNLLTRNLERFANGARTYFDPSGFRTLVRNRFLGQVFGSATNWDNSRAPRKVLASRLRSLVVTVEEEGDMALIVGYAAYKFGARAMLITSHASLIEEGRPSWRDEGTGNLLIVRDLDLRFSDYPDTDGEIDNGQSPRISLMDIHSDRWGLIPSNALVRVISSDPRVAESDHGFSVESRQMGQEAKGEAICYLGLRKPIRSIHSLSRIFSFSGGTTLLSMLPGVEQLEDLAGHGAPYQNLTIAQDLLDQSARYRAAAAVKDRIIAALLAHEAYCLLLRMSEATSLDAIREMNLGEASAEAGFVGVTHTVSTRDRRIELEEMMQAQEFRGNGAAFLSRMWSELKLVYKDDDQFEASEEANAESLINSEWIFSWGQRLLAVKLVKRMLLKPVHSLTWLLGIVFVWPLLLTCLICAVYGWKLSLDTAGLMWFLDMYHHVLISVLRPEALHVHGVSPADGENMLRDSIDMLMSVTSFVYIGLIITVLFRRSTRG